MAARKMGKKMQPLKDTSRSLIISAVMLRATEKGNNSGSRVMLKL